MKRRTNQSQEEIKGLGTTPSNTSTSRRSFLRKGMAVSGAGVISAGLLNAGMLAPGIAFAQQRRDTALPAGDAAILRFLAALEIIETDLWQQYNEVGGIQDKAPDEGDEAVEGGTGIAAYTTGLTNLDGDMPQYIHDNTDDEFTHQNFINAYLKSKGVEPVSLDKFRTLQGSTATGVDKARIGKRLTNLLELTVDTSYWTRYRDSEKNPDLGDTFAQAIPGLADGKFPAIPRNNDDLKGSTDTQPSAHIQAIANTAAFHFGFIEQGGSSLYPSLAQRVSSPEVLRILLSIGPTETMHFQVWHDKAGNAVTPGGSAPVPLTDPTNGLNFPDLSNAGEELQPNLIMPEPTFSFLGRKFPRVSIIRPTETRDAAKGAVDALTADGLFIGQSQEFFTLLNQLAAAADEAERG
jgi:hypothetical protein